MEIWRPIVGFERAYEVSNLGNVRSLDRVILKSNGVLQRRKGRTCNLNTDADGYITVKLNSNGTSKTRRVHRLVYEAFCGHIGADIEIDHIDFDRANNAIENLQALTHTENVARTVLAGRNYAAQNYMNGPSNPNYGNRKLSAKYSRDPELAKEKQSRPGDKNGRAKPVMITLLDGTTLRFGCIRSCIAYLKEHGIIEKCSDAEATTLSRAAKCACEYHGMRVSFV